MLTWNELGGLHNLAKCGEVGLPGETHWQVELSNSNSDWILFVILARVGINRRLHYRGGGP